MWEPVGCMLSKGLSLWDIIEGLIGLTCGYVRGVQGSRCVKYGFFSGLCRDI